MTGHEWTCKCCGRNFSGLKRKLTVHIAGKKFLNDREMGVRSCTPAVMIKQGDQYVPNTEQQALLKRARPLLLYFNGRALEKARKLEWESQAFVWDESEPLAESDE